MNIFLQDIQYALRRLRKSPGYAATAVLTLALGIGATTAIFTLAYQVILRSLPVSHPEQLYKLGKEADRGISGGGQAKWTLFSTDVYRVLKQTPGIAGMAAMESEPSTVSERRAGDASAAVQPLQVRFVTGNYFQFLGVEPFRGRMLTPNDDQTGAASTAVISYALWQDKFAADPNTVGSTVLLSNHPVTIVGISARGFQGESEEKDQLGFWMPLTAEPIFDPNRPSYNYPADNWLAVLTRIPDSHAVGGVQLALQTELRHYAQAHADLSPGSTDAELQRETVEVVPAAGGINDLREQYEASLKLLLSIAGFVLLIACANLANLMLVRSMARRQELAVRSAMGAPRSRLIRQLLVEALALSMMGGVAALAVAYAGTRAILALALKGSAMTGLDATPSLPVLAFAFAVSVVTGLLFGLIPALIASRVQPASSLRGASRSTQESGALPQKILVVFQAALSLALLSTAGLLIANLRHLETQDFHFQPHGRLLVQIDLSAAGYQYAQLDGLYRTFDDRLAHIPGVQSFGYSLFAPLSNGYWQTVANFPGRVSRPSSSYLTDYTNISPDYFKAVGTRVLRGRVFTPGDTASTPHVAVVNQEFADKFFKGRDAIGEHFGSKPEMANEFTIVGVVENTKYRDATKPAKAMFFSPLVQLTHYTVPQDIAAEQSSHFAQTMIFQYQGSAAAMTNAIRETLKSIDPNILMLHVNTYDEQLSSNFTTEDLVVRLTTLFGILALILAAIGLYGVTAYNVGRRTGEIGIRMALGATRSSVLAQVVRTALAQAGLGLAIGIPLALGAAHLLASTLYQTPAFQPMILLGVVMLLLAASALASLLPARRAASIDPMTALRTQ